MVKTNPIPQTNTVRVTSTTDLAKDETYLVTVTPATLKAAIVKIPKTTKKIKTPSAPT